MSENLSDGPAFLDFHLIVNRVGSRADAPFVTVVADAPVSRWGSNFDPFAGGDLETYLGGLSGVARRETREGPRLDWDLGAASGERIAGEGRDTASSWSPSSSDPRIVELGGDLFSALFPPNSNAYELLGRSCHIANSEGRYLRLKLELHHELDNLPWEMIRPSLKGGWAQEINQATLSVVRYVGDIRKPGAGTASGRGGGAKPCVLIVQADPRDRGAGKLAGQLTGSFLSEQKRVQEVLRRHADDLDCVVIQEPGTRERLARQIDELELSGRPVVGLHFIGHGGIDEQGGFLLGVDEELQGERIYGEGLKSALDRARSLRWVIFNACWTASQPVGCPLAGLATWMAVIQNVPTVIAYRRPVETSDAENLAADFYKMVLTQGLPLEAAVRSLQMRYRNPGGLVVLVRSVEGRIQDPFPLGSRSGSQAERPEPATAPHPPVQAPLPQPLRRSQATENEGARLGEMVRIPAGPFRKGLTEPRVAALVRQFREANLPLDFDSARAVLGEEKEEVVELEQCWIDLTPVTNAQFQLFVEATGHLTEAERRGAPGTWRLHADRADHPVVFVTYDDAVAFCEWADKRLPTADEWKKAFRGTDGRPYPWGEVFDVDLCNTAESQRGWETTPVTRFERGRSPYGCYDMVGNVEEWTSTPGPRGNKVILGGSWCMTCQVYGLPVLHRLASTSFHSNELGFRCARDAGD